MKKDQNESFLVDKKKDCFTLTKESIQERIYVIRGEKVMLDFELAEIYGYSTKAFNQQIKRNLDKFDGFIFQLTKEELHNLVGSQFVTSRIWIMGNVGGRTYLPYAFTESGIYMLMTVLRGPLAIEQSRRLVTLFKEMKDYIVTTNNLLPINEVLRLSNQVNQNTSDINDMKNQLSVVMDNFVDVSKHKEFLIMMGRRYEADMKYKEIYNKAKESIIIIDNYISEKTLRLFSNVSNNVHIDIYSNNVSKDKVDDVVLKDFINETKLDVSMRKNIIVSHDRYIIIDRKYMYLSGPSSKDAGNGIGTIIEIENKGIIDYIMKLIDEYTNF